MNIARQPIKIVVTGAESTGKSTLSQALSQHYQCPWIPEFARPYIESLTRDYTFEDVAFIAKNQIRQDEQCTGEMVVFDTWLIITKVWFDFVYGKHPDWLDRFIDSSHIDLFLICDIDLPWVFDPVRENGGENRKILHERYQQEIINYGFNYRVVDGEGHQRLQNAVKHINELLLH